MLRTCNLYGTSIGNYDIRSSANSIHYGCEYQRGVVLRAATDATLADAIALVANASRAVADVGIEARKASDGEFRISVIARIRGVVGDRLREPEPVEGISGRSYRIGGVVLDRYQASPEAFATRATVGDRFTEFYDLRRAHQKVRMGSVSV